MRIGLDQYLLIGLWKALLVLTYDGRDGRSIDRFGVHSDGRCIVPVLLESRDVNITRQVILVLISEVHLLLLHLLVVHLRVNYGLRLIARRTLLLHIAVSKLCVS